MSSPALGRLSIKSMREHVAETLRKAIFDGTFKPGDLLPDTALAQQLNVSRGPVREALLQLEKESLVRNVHNHGWYVIQLTAEEVSEIISLRCLLEATALKLAASRVTPEELKQLTAIQAGLRRCVKEGQTIAVLSQDVAFHRCLWSLSRHKLLEETLVKITAPYFAYMQAVIRSLSLPMKEYQSTLATHQVIVDYLAGRCAITAEECIAAHMAPLRIRDWNRLLDISNVSKPRKRRQKGKR